MTDQTVTLGDIRFDNSAPFVLLGGVNLVVKTEKAARLQFLELGENHQFLTRVAFSKMHADVMDKSNHRSLGVAPIANLVYLIIQMPEY